MKIGAQDGKVRLFGLVIGADGKAKVDDWGRLTPEERRIVEEFNQRTTENGRDPCNCAP